MIAPPMNSDQAAWVRDNGWPAWMRAMNNDYPGRGCFLFRMCHCQLGTCVPCSQDEPRHDRCLTRQHDGRPLGWDMSVWAWTKGRQPMDGRPVAKVTLTICDCRWRCPCGCWRKPLLKPEPAQVAAPARPVQLAFNFAAVA